MAISKELIQQLREHMKMFTDVNSISVTFKTEDAKALLDEIERLQGENERLKKEIDFAYKPL